MSFLIAEQEMTPYFNGGTRVELHLIQMDLSQLILDSKSHKIYIYIYIYIYMKQNSYQSAQ
jgi:hypothetical protein